jgi:hypothetical protein
MGNGSSKGKKRIDREKEDEMGKGEMRKKKNILGEKRAKIGERGVSCENRDKEGNLGKRG